MAEKGSQVFNSKEGVLAKTGSNNKGWKDRYFRLKEGKLYYYKSEKDSTELGYIDLRECIKVTKAHGKKGYGFDIHVPGRIYNLSARVESDVDEWIAAIDVSVAVIKTVYGDLESRTGSFLERSKRFDSFSSTDQEGVGLSDVQSDRKSEPDFHSLLEAEIKALTTKSSQLEHELQSIQSQRDELLQQLQNAKSDQEIASKHYEEELSFLKDEVESLKNAKSSLETVNDSLRAQIQEKEMMNLEQQLGEEIRELEEENRTLLEDIERLKELQVEITKENEALIQSNMDLHKRLSNAVQEESKKDDSLNIPNPESERNQTLQGNLEELQAERLKLQVELENIRNDAKEKMNELLATSNELTEANSLIKDLNSQLNELKDTNSLLKIEREKATSDLITLKKTMKEKERMISSEDENTSPNNTIARDTKLLEAEKRAEMATKLLKEIQAERDFLKTQMKKQGFARPPVVQGDSNSLLMVSSEFKRKSSPTTALSSVGDNPPPKPRRPDTDILDRLIF